MFWLLFLADTATQSLTNEPPPAKAVVRIERATAVSRESWSRAAPPERREIRRIDEQGRPIILRLIEHQ
jgi:hypothetical protein